MPYPPDSLRHQGAGKITSKKKAFLHWQGLVLKAFCDFRNELHEHVEKAKKDQLRFQTGRLFKALIQHIKAEATGRDEWVAMFACYQFATDTSGYLGYDEARRLHDEEMNARGLSSPRSFCSRLVSFIKDSSLEELTFRVRSIASWMEAQESFQVWLIFKELRRAWRDDLDARARALQACYLSQLPHRLTAKQKSRIGTNYDNKPWTSQQWKNILEHAVRLTKKRYDCEEWEEWLWWCYPVFQQYGWNTREVVDAAIKRGFTFRKESMYQPENFRRHLMSIGLRFKFTGKKQKRGRTPPLSEFVENVVLPDQKKMWGAFGGLVTKIN